MDITRAIALPLILMILGMTGCGGLFDNIVTVVPPPAQNQPRQDIRQARATLLGKPPAEIAAAVGKPDRTSVNGQREWWMYHDRFADPVAGIDLPIVTFRFHADKLEAVTY